MKTYQPLKKEVKRSWHLVDVEGEVLGRVATKIANLLTGKGKVTYSRHMDSGDYVVALNSEKIVLTGKKDSQKVYRSHSGYPGGFKEKSFKQVMETHPERVLEHAVNGMIPDNRLKAKRMKRFMAVVGGVNPFESKFEDKKTESESK